MAGRNYHRGGRGGRGGRGRSSNSNNSQRKGNDGQNRPNAKKTFAQCEYKTSKAGEYVETTEVITNHINKNTNMEMISRQR